MIDWNKWKQSKIGRTVRRAVAVFVTGGLSALIVYYGNLPAESSTIVIMVILLTVDKAVREYLKEEEVSK